MNNMNNINEEGYHAVYHAFNRYDVPLRVLSDITAFNNTLIQPGDGLDIPMFIPGGLRHWSYSCRLNGEPCIWIGMIDKDAPDLGANNR